MDSLAASSGYGLLMDKLADLRDGGMGIDELSVSPGRVLSVRKKIRDLDLNEKPFKNY